MFKLLSIFFIFYLYFTNADSLQQTRNCSNELEPLLHLVFNQRKKTGLIPMEDQISLEHDTPHFDVEPCDLHQYSQNFIEPNHYHKKYLQNICK